MTSFMKFMHREPKSPQILSFFGLQKSAKIILGCIKFDFIYCSVVIQNNEFEYNGTGDIEALFGVFLETNIKIHETQEAFCPSLCCSTHLKFLKSIIEN